MASDPQDRVPGLRAEKGNQFIPPKDRREEGSVHAPPDLEATPERDPDPDPMPVTGDNPHPGAHGNPVHSNRAPHYSGTLERAVVAVFERREHCEDAVQRLVDEGGFEKDQMSLLVTDGLYRDIDEEEFLEMDVDRIEGERPSADELGGVFGALVAGLAQLGGGVANPTYGLYGSGPLYAAVASTPPDADEDRGIHDALARMGIAPEHMDQHLKMVQDGGLLLAVHTDAAPDVERAREILEDCEVMEVRAQPPGAAPEAA